MSSRSLAGLLVLSALAVTVGACSVRETPRDTGPGGSSDVPPGSGGPLRIEPADRVEAITGGVPVTIDYHAFLRAADGSERDVTAEATWSSTVPALGAFTGARFVSGTELGGLTTIRAQMGSAIAVTSLTLTLDRVIVVSPAPADAPTRFGGAVDPSVGTELVYPNDGVVIPPNLGELEFHYRTGGAELFELHFDTPAVDLSIYFACPEDVPGGCIYTPDRAAWDAISTAAAGTGEFTYTIRGVDSAGRVSPTVSQRMRVAAEPITGGLYYWNAAAATGAIVRFEFGVRGARRENFIDIARAGGSFCVGCHTLSADGTRMTVGADTPTEIMTMYDVATRDVIWRTGMTTLPLLPPSPTEPNYVALNTDGSLLAGSSLMGLYFRDGTNGEITAGPIGGGPSEMPEFSPDGQHLVYVSMPSGPVFPGLYDANNVSSGSIHVLDYDGATWVPRAAPLVTGGGNNYFPTYTPDGEWIVFNRSPSNTGSLGMDPMTAEGAIVRDAQLWAIRADGSSGAIQLLAPSGLGDAWPNFDLTEYESDGRPLYWFTWSSRRAFGLRYDAEDATQLWMAAFDPTRAAAGMDPTFAAFRLPFQEMHQANLIAQWVTSVERMACTTDAECGGEFCVDGRCYQTPPAPF